MQGTILIAEDEADIADMMRQGLEAKGHRVILASDGFFAVMKINDEKPNLIIMDIRMPGAYGLTVYQSLQDDPVTAATPVIFISGILTEDTFRTKVPSGKVRFLPKPFEMDRLLACVDELMRKEVRA